MLKKIIFLFLVSLNCHSQALPESYQQTDENLSEDIRARFEKIEVCNNLVSEDDEQSVRNEKLKTCMAGQGFKMME